jgi:hypothetical protein
MSVLVLENFVFEEPDGSSGDTLVAAAVLGALVRGMQGIRHGFSPSVCDFRLRIA